MNRPMIDGIVLILTNQFINFIDVRRQIVVKIIAFDSVSKALYSQKLVIGDITDSRTKTVDQFAELFPLLCELLLKHCRGFNEETVKVLIN